VIVAVTSVLYLAVWTGQRNTVELGRERAELIVALAQERIKQKLDPAYSEIAFLADVVEKRHLDPLHDPSFIDLAGGALSATPQVTAIGYVSTDYRLIRVFRSEETGIKSVVERLDSPQLKAAMSETREAPRPYWGDIFWSESLKQPLINLRAPVRDGDRFLGAMFVVLSVANISSALGEVAENFAATAFILVDRDRVLAHPNLVYGFPGSSAADPLPRIDQVQDPVLAAIWAPQGILDQERSKRFLGGRGHIGHVGGKPYLYIYQASFDYGRQPWLIGTYMHEATLETAIDRLMQAIVAGLGIMLIAAFIAWWVGRTLTRQIGMLAATARSIRRLDFDHARHLRPSRLRELDDAAAAFNAMLEGLRWFEAYVPRALVKRLMRVGSAENIQSVERNVTVMFTDIAGFTTLSERMTAPEVASFLNTHFTLVDSCIDAEGGTVDKHLGDGVMAFWGAPEMQDDHALRACRAALAIMRAVNRDNDRRRQGGGAAVRLRIGIHTGPATVGNIGGATRISYTIVGDTVNTADRLCELGKQVGADGNDVVVLLSGETGALVQPHVELVPFGAHVLRGRHGGTEIYRLVGEKF